MVAGAYHVIPPSKALKDLVFGLLYLNNQKNVAYEYGVTTGNMITMKSAFKEVGFFDEELPTGNDIKWSKKALKKGYEVVYVPDMKVDYQGQSFLQLKTSVIKYMKGVAHQKQGTFSHLFTVFTYFLPMRTSNFKEALNYRELENLSTLNKYYLWFCIWKLKCRMGIAYAIHLFNKDK